MHACVCTHIHRHTHEYGEEQQKALTLTSGCHMHSYTNNKYAYIHTSHTHIPQKYHYFTNNKLKWNIQSYIILPISDVNIAPVQEAIICWRGVTGVVGGGPSVSGSIFLTSLKKRSVEAKIKQYMYTYKYNIYNICIYVIRFSGKYLQNYLPNYKNNNQECSLNILKSWVCSSALQT